MKKERGFTLVELLVVIFITGILSATAIPLYSTYRQRAFGSEAVVMMKQIMDGQIMYFLENENFFPGPNETYQVLEDGSGIPEEAVQEIRNALKITITTKGNLTYQISNTSTSEEDKSCFVKIEADFPIFKNDQTYLWATIDNEGKVKYVDFDSFG